MVDGLNIFCKEKIDKEKVIETLGISKDNILFIDGLEGWADKKKEEIVIEYKGLMTEEDEHPGYYLYDVSLDKSELKDIFNKLENENTIIDME